MAITPARTTSPWWNSLLFFVGLLLMFLGQRAFAHAASASMIFTWGGIALLAATTTLRAWAFGGSAGDLKRVEKVLLFCQLGALLALLVYMLGSGWGVKALGLGTWSDKKLQHYQGAMTVVWLVIMAAALVPMAMIEFSLGVSRRTHFAVGKPATEHGMEYMRVRDIGWSGLTVALALGLLMVTCSVAQQKNIRKDVSYFRTASPGASTIAMVASNTEPLKALMFFPTVNEMKTEVRGYFDELAQRTRKLEITEHDRLVDSATAAKYKVTKDGVVVLVKGDKSEIIDIGTDFERDRKLGGKLRALDRDINAALTKVMRAKRKAYVTVGHGELNDRDSIAPILRDTIPERTTAVLRQAITFLGYEYHDLAPMDLAHDVPADATVLLVLGPTQALAAAEIAALDRYLTKGGRLMLALNPLGEATLGALEGKLGLTFDKGILTDDKEFYPERNSESDFRNVATSQVSAHASTTSLSRSNRAQLPVVVSGTLRDHAFAPGEAPRRTYIIKSGDSSWVDHNNNFKFDAAATPAEKREKYNVAAAIEGPRVPLTPDELKAAQAAHDAAKAKEKEEDKDDDHGHHDEEGPEKDKDGFRALVYGNPNFFADALGVDNAGRTRRTMIGGDFFVFDAIRWLGGEEVFSGEIVSEDDKPLKHTKSENAAWFWMTILGAPLLVLGLGLLITSRRKRHAPAQGAKA